MVCLENTLHYSGVNDLQRCWGGFDACEHRGKEVWNGDCTDRARAGPAVFLVFFVSKLMNRWNQEQYVKLDLAEVICVLPSFA